MFLINAIATVIAAAIVLGIFLWLQRRELEATWGDARRGLWMALLRTGILQLSHEDDTKNWRPHILTLSGSPSRRWSLVELANALTHNRGLVTVSSVLPSGSRDMGQQADMEATIRDYLERRGVRALVRLTTASDPFEGALQLVETYGIGPIVPNTILLGDSEAPERRESYCNLIAETNRARRNIVILRENEEKRFGNYQRIDVWWGGMQGNGGLMLLLADLLHNTIEWRNADIFLKLVVPDEAAAEAAHTNLNRLVQYLRIPATSKVLVADGRPFNDILHESSGFADLVFLGMASPDVIEDYPSYYAALQNRTTDLPTTVFVLATADFDFTDVLAEK